MGSSHSTDPWGEKARRPSKHEPHTQAQTVRACAQRAEIAQEEDVSDDDGDEKTGKRGELEKKRTTGAGRTKEKKKKSGRAGTRGSGALVMRAPRAEGDRNIHTGTVQTLGTYINTSVGYSRQRAFCRRLSFMAVL